MYRIAEAKGVENLIAGAWGSRNYNIPNIYFAIPAILEFSWRFCN